MSVLIKNMGMPTSCCNCPIAKLSPTGGTLICNYTLSTVPWDDKPFDCPLVPVPKHGRLIDADALTDELWKQRRNYQMLDDTQTADKVMHGLYRAEQILKDAPTIIPAEEGEW